MLRKEKVIMGYQTLKKRRAVTFDKEVDVIKGREEGETLFHTGSALGLNH
jgi:hypothetical protein